MVLAEMLTLLTKWKIAVLFLLAPPLMLSAQWVTKLLPLKLMKAAGVPTVPGSDGPLSEDPNQLIATAERIGYPVIIKAAAGGGGRGMRVVEDQESLMQ